MSTSEVSKKEYIPKKDWFQDTGKVHNQWAAGVATLEVVGDVQLEFRGLQKAEEVEDPELIIDSGSTISLFWHICVLKEVKKAISKLVMETNAGDKQIMEKENIPGYGEVWYYPSTFSNMFYLSDMVKRGNHVEYDSRNWNGFLVHKKYGNIIKFSLDDQGIYVKSEVVSVKDHYNFDDGLPLLHRTEMSNEDNSDDNIVPPLISFSKSKEEEDSEDLGDEEEVRDSLADYQVHTQRVEGFMPCNVEPTILNLRCCYKLISSTTTQ